MILDYHGLCHDSGLRMRALIVSMQATAPLLDGSAVATPTHHTRWQTPLRCSRTLLTVAMLCCATGGTNRLVAISVAPPRNTHLTVAMLCCATRGTHTSRSQCFVAPPVKIPFLTVAMLCCATRGSLTRPQSSLRCPPTSFIAAILNCVTLVNTFSKTQPTGSPLLANNRGRNPQLRRPSLLSAVAVYAAPSAKIIFIFFICCAAGPLPTDYNRSSTDRPGPSAVGRPHR